MEAFAFYLLKSVIWLSGFAFVYLLFLRNERFFTLNRFFLLAGIIASMLFPFISIHYTVILPVTENFSTGNISVAQIEKPETSTLIDFGSLMFILYASGALFVVYKVIRQSRTVINVIKKADVKVLNSVRLIRTPEYTNSFSFFSYVFVNPSVTDIETEEIVNHEMAHIRQRHWFDLVLVELLCMLQWFNPVAWIYIRFIKQNHEYLADEVALQRSSDPAIYRATLLNQIVGYPVIILANSFNSSINKKRFIMMKNKISSPYRKLKLLLILPVIAVVLYSFAKPEYKYISYDETSSTASLSSQASKEVKGTIVNPSGLPLTGATVVLKGTTMGVTTDPRGFFQLKDVPENGILIVSYVGFKTKAIKPVFTADMKIKMESDTVTLKSIGVPPPPPPPPPPLYVIDGKVSEKHYNSVKKENTESIKVLKVDAAIAKYGDKAKYGAIEITTKNKAGLKAEELNEKNAESIPPPPPPPPPPPASEVRIRNTDGSEAQPLIVIDGINRGKDGLNGINPDDIGSMTVLKDQPAIDKYGVEGRDGVIIITSKGHRTTGFNDSSSFKVTGYGQQQKTLPGGGLNYRSQYGGKPLLLVNGFERDIDINEISPDQIESINVKKNDPAAASLYGEKAKDGVIEITLKQGVNPNDLQRKSDSQIESVKVTGYGVQKGEPVSNKDVFFVVEEMPAFPGGEKALQSYIYNNIKVMKGSEKISEPVLVVFTVDSKGKVRDATVLKKKYPVWEAEAIRVVSSMPDWKPGMQHGIPVDVMVQLPIDFSTVKK
ncbi:MAG: TonB-dependent receptor plug domain-containing protein [Bacteroidales bacterium]|nr:TonB-dependent receptor plug domain-containing protein [Bacteroidales bacterium]